MKVAVPLGACRRPVLAAFVGLRGVAVARIPKGDAAEALGRSGDGEPEVTGGRRHALVVGDDTGEVLSKPLGGRGVDGVQASQRHRLERTRQVEHPIVHSHEVQTSEDPPARGLCGIATRKERTEDLGPSEGAGDQRPPTRRCFRRASDSGSRTASLTIAVESR